MSASSDSDVIAPPAQQRFTLEDIEVRPASFLPGVAMPTSVEQNGHFVIGDGVITEAHLEAAYGDEHNTSAHASFDLTQPVTLRRDLDDDSAFSASGTLTVNGVERKDTAVQFTVVTLDDTAATFDVLVDAPVALLAAANKDAGIAARIRFTAG